MTMESVNKCLKPITYFRKWYYTPNYAGMIDRQQRIAFVIADIGEDGNCVNICDYATGDARPSNHYYMTDGCVDITDIIIDWMKGEYNKDGVTARESSRYARKAVIKEIIERCEKEEGGN